MYTCSGGSAGLIYSYLFSFIGSIAIFTTMGELASMLADLLFQVQSNHLKKRVTYDKGLPHLEDSIIGRPCWHRLFAESLSAISWVRSMSFSHWDQHKTDY